MYVYINSCTPPKRMRREIQEKKKEQFNYPERHKRESPYTSTANRFKFMPFVVRYQSLSRFIF